MLHDYIAMDLEMTGTQVKKDKITEIGACRVHDGEIVAEFHTMVDPGCEIPEYVQELTGIHPEMLVGAPSQSEAVAAFLDFAGEDVVLGHNIMFDYSFIKAAATDMNRKFENRALDTLKIARFWLPEEQQKKLEALAKFFGIEHNPHRALDDARATALVYEKLIATYGEDAKRPEIFEPQIVQMKTKKSQPATEGQKARLRRLAEMYGITLTVDFDTLTRSNASRMSDELVAKYGAVPKQ